MLKSCSPVLVTVACSLPGPLGTDGILGNVDKDSVVQVLQLVDKVNVLQVDSVCQVPSLCQVDNVFDIRKVQDIHKNNCALSVVLKAMKMLCMQ